MEVQYTSEESEWPGANARPDTEEQAAVPETPVDLSEEQTIIAALERGEIPELLREVLRVIPESDLASADFQQQVVAALKEFAPHEYDPQQRALRVFLSDLDQPNGFAVACAKPPIMILTRSLFDREHPLAPKTLDARLGCILHEAAHLVFRDRWELEAGTKGEEAAADILAVRLLFEHGYDPRAYLDWMRTLADEPEYDSPAKKDLTYFLRRFKRIIDPHPLPALRVSVIEAEISRLERQEKEITCQPAALPEDDALAHLARSARHSSYVQSFLLRSGFREATLDEKGVILADLLAGQQWNPARATDLKMELKNFGAELRLAGDATQPVLSTLVDTILTQLLQLREGQRGKSDDDNVSHAQATRMEAHAIALEACYLALSEGLAGDGVHTPLGRLASLAACMEKSVQAESGAAQCDALESLARYVCADPLLATTHLRNFYSQLRWPVYPLPRTSGEIVSWQAALACGIERARSGSDLALLGLLYMGVEDPRMFSHLSWETCLRFLEMPYAYTSPSTHSDSVVVGISQGDSLKIDFADTDIRGKPCQTEKSVTIHHLSIGEDGCAELPTSWETIRSLCQGSAGQRMRGIFRDEIQTAITDPLPPLIRDPAVVKQNASYLWREFASHAALIREDLLIPRPDDFLALNAQALQNPELQRRVVELYEDSFRALRASVRKIAETPLGISLRAGIKQALKANGEKIESSPGFCSPFFLYQLNEEHGFFSPEEKLEYLSADLEEIQEKSRIIEALPVLRAVIPDSIALDAGTWHSLVETLRAVRNYYSALATPKDASEEEIKLYYSHRADRFLSAVAEVLTPDIPQLGTPTVAEAADLFELIWSPQLANKDERLSLEEFFLTFLERDIEWSTEPREAVRQWLALSRAHRGIPADRMDIEAERCFRGCDWKSVSAEEKARLCAELLAGGHITYTALHESIMQEWCDSLLAIIGRDDNSAGYEAKLDPHISTIESFSGLVSQNRAAEKLARALCLQGRTARRCRDSLQRVTNTRAWSAHTAWIGGELMLNAASEDPQARKDLLNFLISPLSDASIRALLDAYEDRYFIGVVGLEDNTERSRGRYRIEKEQALRSFHKNYWDIPIEARTVFARELLIPSEGGSVLNLEEAFLFVLDRLCPPESAHFDFANRFVRSYIKHLPPHSQALYLTALMVGAHPVEGEAFRLGRSLSLVAAALGPIEKRILQAAHSHPDTSAEVQRDIEHSKTMIGEPNRWELFDLLDDPAIIPSSIRSQISHVGEILGAASFFISVEVTLVDGQEVVLQLLRPNALDQANTGLKRLRAVGREMIVTDSAGGQLILDLCDEAERTLLSEIDMFQAVQKIQFMHARYARTSLEVDGYPFVFEAPKIVSSVCLPEAFGKYFRFVTKVCGQHFTEFARTTAETDARRLRASAKAIALCELAPALAGEPMDDDWHGGNIKVRDATVCRFDPGGLTLAPPDEDELLELGRALAYSFNNFIKSDPASSFLEYLRAIRREGRDVPPLLRRFQKSLLTYGEYRRFLNAADENQLFLQLAAHAHPLVKEGFQGGWSTVS